MKHFVALLVVLATTTGPAAGACVGDCDDSGVVSVEEIVLGVSIALGTLPLDECRSLDDNGDGVVSIDELITAVTALLGDCEPVVVVGFDFRNGTQGWEAGFADYHQDQEPGLELQSGLSELPAELQDSGTGFLLSGNNHSDDLFMFLKRRLSAADGVAPNRQYAVSLRIRVASASPSGCAGIGGAPGESVFLKAGAGRVEPLVAVDTAGDVRLNVDKGNQAEGGPAASIVSHIANGRACEAPVEYVTLERSHVHHLTIETNAAAETWLLVGTDSGFEGTTTLYYQSIEVTLTPL